MFRCDDLPTDLVKFSTSKTSPTIVAPIILSSFLLDHPSFASKFSLTSSNLPCTPNLWSFSLTFATHTHTSTVFAMLGPLPRSSCADHSRFAPAAWDWSKSHSLSLAHAPNEPCATVHPIESSPAKVVPFPDAPCSFFQPQLAPSLPSTISCALLAKQFRWLSFSVRQECRFSSKSPLLLGLSSHARLSKIWHMREDSE